MAHRRGERLVVRRGGLVEVIAPTEPVLEVLRAISGADFAYVPTKALCGTAGWQLVDDEPDLGYLTYSMDLEASSKERRLLSVLIAESNKPPFVYVPLFFFEEYDKCREPFDLAFRTIAEQLAGFFGAATRTGAYSYSHRADWPYSFTGWSLADATPGAIASQRRVPRPRLCVAVRSCEWGKGWPCRQGLTTQMGPASAVFKIGQMIEETVRYGLHWIRLLARPRKAVAVAPKTKQAWQWHPAEISRVA